MKAIILAAGQGTRLRPKTDDLPKCLVNVRNRPIMKYQLESLNEAGITDCVIVIGFMGHLIEQEFGYRFGNLDITYVTNDQFEETNNLYSLWSAKEYLSDDITLIEGDVLFDHHILNEILGQSCRDIAVVDEFRPGMNGTIVFEKDGLVTSMILKSQQGAHFDYSNAFKTVNVYLLSNGVMRSLMLPTLDQWVERGLTNEYYEATIADLIQHKHLKLATHHVGKRKWAEIDTLEDLILAESQFFHVN